MKKLLDELRERTIWQVVIVYLGASWVLLQAIDVFADNLDLPGWLFPTAGALLLVGLPIILVTAFIQRRLAASGEVADEAHRGCSPGATRCSAARGRSSCSASLGCTW